MIVAWNSYGYDFISSNTEKFQLIFFLTQQILAVIELNKFGLVKFGMNSSILKFEYVLRVNTRIKVYKKRSKKLYSLDFAFLYSRFLFLMVIFG